MHGASRFVEMPRCSSRGPFALLREHTDPSPTPDPCGGLDDEYETRLHTRGVRDKLRTVRSQFPVNSPRSASVERDSSVQQPHARVGNELGQTPAQFQYIAGPATFRARNAQSAFRTPLPVRMPQSGSPVPQQQLVAGAFTRGPAVAFCQSQNSRSLSPVAQRPCVFSDRCRTIQQSKATTLGQSGSATTLRPVLRLPAPSPRGGSMAVAMPRQLTSRWSPSLQPPARLESAPAARQINDSNTVVATTQALGRLASERRLPLRETLASSNTHGSSTKLSEHMPTGIENSRDGASNMYTFDGPLAPPASLGMSAAGVSRSPGKCEVVVLSRESEEKDASDIDGEATTSTAIAEISHGSSFSLSPGGSACSPVSLQVGDDSPVSFVQRDRDSRGDTDDDRCATAAHEKPCDWLRHRKLVDPHCSSPPDRALAFPPKRALATAESISGCLLVDCAESLNAKIQETTERLSKQANEHFLPPGVARRVGPPSVENRRGTSHDTNISTTPTDGSGVDLSDDFNLSGASSSSLGSQMEMPPLKSPRALNSYGSFFGTSVPQMSAEITHDIFGNIVGASEEQPSGLSYDEASPARDGANDSFESFPSALDEIWRHDHNLNRADRQVTIVIPEAVGDDRKVRILLKNMQMELIVPEGCSAGEEVVVDMPTVAPMRGPEQRKLLEDEVLMTRLRWDLQEDGQHRADPVAKAKKIDACSKLRGRMMGLVLVPLHEIPDENDDAEEVCAA